MFAASRSSWCIVSLHGHTGGAVQHCVVHRCSYFALGRRVAQFDSLLKAHCAGGGIHSSGVIWALAWVVFTT